MFGFFHFHVQLWQCTVVYVIKIKNILISPVLFHVRCICPLFLIMHQQFPHSFRNTHKVGPMQVTNHTSGMVCQLEFHPSGWLSNSTNQVTGQLLTSVANPQSDVVRCFYGNWTRGLFTVPPEVWSSREQITSQKSSSILDKQLKSDNAVCLMIILWSVHCCSLLFTSTAECIVINYGMAGIVNWQFFSGLANWQWDIMKRIKDK